VSRAASSRPGGLDGVGPGTAVSCALDRYRQLAPAAGAATFRRVIPGVGRFALIRA
jgi:hypothetical protein